MGLGSFITLQDLTTPAGSRVFGGSIIYIQANSLDYGMKVSVGFKPKPLAPVGLETSDVGSEYLNFSRRKGYLQYVGILNPNITIKGAWDINGGTETAGGDLLATPHRLMKLALVGRTLYLNDKRLVPSLESGDASHEGIYGGSGIPVVIDDVSFDTEAKNENIISFSISLIEDKEVTDTR